MTPRQIRIALTTAGVWCCLVAPADGVEISIVANVSHRAMPTVLGVGSASRMGELVVDAAALPTGSDSGAAWSAGTQPDEGSAQQADETLVWFGVPGMVPEPSTPMLWLIGLVALGWVVRRRS